MSHKLPADVDRLLWEVAESQDPKAFDDFEVRFPHLVLELGQRIKLVREFRGARSDAVTTVRAPRFDYRDPSPAPINRLAWVGGGFALAALGFAAFLVTKQMMPAPAPPIPDPAPRSFIISDTGSKPIVRPTTAPPHPPIQPAIPNNQPDDATNYRGPKWEQHQDVSYPHERLQTVLAAIAYRGGLNIVFAPNTPNPTIAMEYHGMNSVDIIQDLGRKFGFTPLKNGPSDVLIVPALDPNAKDTPVSGQGIATNLDAQPPTESAAPKPSDNSSKEEPSKAKAKPVGPN